jgi:PAS domain S-box-containing protein
VDCILLDLLMPGLSGHETCRRIKESSSLRDIPLLMLSGVEDREAVIEAINAGADDYIPKSSDFDVVRARVRAALRRKQFEDENRKVSEQSLRMEMEAAEARAQLALAKSRAELLSKLQQSNDRLEFALHVGGLGEWEIDLQSHAMSRSRRHDEIFGYDDSPPEWSYELLLEHVLPEHRDEVDASFKTALANNSVWNIETRIRRKDGDIRWIASQGKIATVRAEKPATMIGINMDITARKQTELALQEREQQLRAILDVLPVAVFMCDAGGKLIEANPAASQMWDANVPLVELQQHREYKGRRPGTNHALALDEWGLSRAALHGIITREEEIEIETFDGARKTILNSALPVRDAQGAILGAVSVHIDITERKRAEQALIRSEKLASAGRMAATIAHEVNNPLAAVSNALFLIGSNPDLSPSLREYHELADRELRRAAHMVKQTLGFYREVGTATAVNLPGIVDEVLHLFEARLKNSTVRVERKYNSKTPIHAIEGEMRQVVSNLVVNSIDAMPPGGGTLHLRTVGPVCVEQRPMVRLTIADSGVGIAGEHRKRIFEPFFTTKQSFGTGLGLWVSSELVKKHDGRIRVRSQTGKGTVVTIWLPVERRVEER